MNNFMETEYKKREKQLRKKIKGFDKRIEALQTSKRAARSELNKLLQEQKEANTDPDSLPAKKYAEKFNLAIVDYEDNEIFTIESPNESTVYFWKKGKFYPFLAWLDESCETEQFKGKTLIKNEAVQNLVEKLARLNTEQIEELRTGFDRGEKEKADDWKRRFVPILLKPWMKDILSKQRKEELALTMGRLNS